MKSAGALLLFFALVLAPGLGAQGGVVSVFACGTSAAHCCAHRAKPPSPGHAHKSSCAECTLCSVGCSGIIFFADNFPGISPAAFVWLRQPAEKGLERKDPPPLPPPRFEA